MIVAAIDVGKYENLGVCITGKDDISPDTFFSSFIDEVKSKKGAIGFEAPLFIPTGNIKNITKSRWAEVEGKEQNIDSVCKANRPWSFTPSFYCVIPLLDIFFFELAQYKIPIFTDREAFEKASAGILIFEAFISGGGKGLKGDKRKEFIKKYYQDKDNHNHDAEYACKLYIEGVKKAKKMTCTTPYINLPVLVAQKHKINISGKINKGLIVQSPKPCFKEELKYGVVIDLSWDR